VKPIEPPDAHHFNAATGWLELGNHREARDELDLISAVNQSHPAVLDLRWMLCAATNQWDEGFRVAQELITALPEEPACWLHCAYALRRKTGGGLDQARDFLEPAAEKFPTEPVIAFNLACYACQLNQLDAARRWLSRASEIGGVKKIQAMALADTDLRALWPELQKS
jgi:Flp pilus assembly protein TadD